MDENKNNQNGAANEQPVVVENEKKMTLGKKIAISIGALVVIGGGIFLAVKKPWKKNR